jgi:hypothetical protein
MFDYEVEDKRTRDKRVEAWQTSLRLEVRSGPQDEDELRFLLLNIRKIKNLCGCYGGRDAS